MRPINSIEAPGQLNDLSDPPIERTPRDDNQVEDTWDKSSGPALQDIAHAIMETGREPPRAEPETQRKRVVGEEPNAGPDNQRKRPAGDEKKPG